MLYQERELVVLRHDVPDSGLFEGDVGAVVGVYASGGYEIEFAAADGVPSPSSRCRKRALQSLWSVTVAMTTPTLHTVES